jgi:ribonuclease BN (tRNA processing enzyme)
MGQAMFTVLGCGDAFSCGGRNNTCFHLQTAAGGVLIDCGGGALAAIKKQKLTTDDIDIIVLAHFHGDHYAGLPFVVFDAARMRRSKPLTIISPPGGRQKLEQVFALFYPGADKALSGLKLGYKEYCGRDRLRLPALQLKTYPVIHSKETLPHAIRLQMDGIVLAYSGDTEWTDMLPALYAGTDLAICECTFFEKQEKNHVSYATLKQHLQDLHCKRLLLTHFDDDMLAHIDEVSPECAYDGLQIQL